jgi:4-hydroxy-tetrahydrodipicolinate reductase
MLIKKQMKIFIVGSGKLANAVISAGLTFPSYELTKWEDSSKDNYERAVIVHAGSGRQLHECLDYCEKTDSVFIELSTGLETENLEPNFTLIICPNTSILLLKALNILKKFGGHFDKEKISIIESHQSSKKTEPGTAYNFANSLKFPVEKIQSIRDKDVQLNEIGIPAEYLDKHAYHKIIIQDDLDEVTIETKVLGHASYAKGVEKIINSVLKHPLEKRKYSILDLIDNKLI